MLQSLIAALPGRLIHFADALFRPLNKLTSTNFGRAALPLVLAFVLCCHNLWVFPKFESFYTELCQIDLGGYFLAGLPMSGINLNMPFAEILVSAALNLGIGPDPLYILLHMGVYALVFFTGCLISGYRAGLVALLAAGLFGGGHDLVYEQAMYSYFLLLVLALLLLQREKKSLSNSLLLGLAMGSSMLIRSPLFLFAPLFLFCDRPRQGELWAPFLRRSLVFLAAFCVLLLPWGCLNRSVTGEFSVLDAQRGSNNVITAAMGSIYTAYGDTRKAAGLTNEDSAFAFYVGAAAEKPFFYALTVLRRLWHIFLFYPVLFTLFLLALAVSRGKDRTLLFCLPVYFVLIHAVLAIEKRYFYPLTYLLPPLLAGAFLPRPSGDFPETRAVARTAVLAAFWLVFGAVLCVEALVLAYPRRAASHRPAADTYQRASARLPEDKRLYGMKCEELWINGSDKEYRSCLREYSLKFRDTTKRYFLAVIYSSSPAAITLPAKDDIHGDINYYYTLRMLREFELGDRRAAMATLRLIYNTSRSSGTSYSGDWQQLAPYSKDKELRDFIKEDTDWVWNGSVYEALRMWPPERMKRILSQIAMSVPLTPRLERLNELLRGVRTGGGDVQLRRRIKQGMSNPAGFTPGNGRSGDGRSGNGQPGSAQSGDGRSGYGYPGSGGQGMPAGGYGPSGQNYGYE